MKLSLKFCYKFIVGHAWFWINGGRGKVQGRVRGREGESLREGGIEKVREYHLLLSTWEAS